MRGTTLETTKLGTTLAITPRRTPVARISLRQRLLTFTAFALIAGACMSCRADDSTLDTTRLPRLDGARELFAFPQTTGYIAGGSVAQAAEAAGKLLTADGWVQYNVHAAAAEHPDLDTREFRKGPLALTVMVQRAPAQGNATTVSYTATVAVDRDQPSPKPAPGAAAPVVAETQQDKPAAPALVELTRLPRLDGAKEDSRSSTSQFVYSVAGTVPSAVAATKKLLAADGWQEYVSPSGGARTTAYRVRKGQQSLSVSFSTIGERTDQSLVYYSSERLTYAVPFPAVATDIVFDQNRPYLSCITTGTIDQNLDVLQKGLGALGWSPLSAAEAAARWPNQTIDDKIENGVRVYYVGKEENVDKRQRPIMLVLQRRGDDRINVELRVAPFAQPQELAAGHESFDMPVPQIAIDSFGQGGNRKELRVLVPAEVAPVLAFYRRELAKHDLKEEPKGAVINPDQVALTFSSAEATATLKLGRQYDLTTVNLVVQIPEAVVAAAKAKAEKEADERVRAVLAEDAKRAAAVQAARGPEAPLHALADKVAPVPLPETAENIDFNATDGKLEFESSSSVKAVAAFYRAAMKPLGWKEQPSVINGANLVELDFSKGGKELTFTAIQLGPKVNVRVNGSGLVAAAKPNMADNQAATPANAVAQALEADEDSGLPVPKQHTLSSVGAASMPGGQSPFRRELTASVPADLGAVLAFYRRELGKREWKETAQGAVVKPDRVWLAFTSPEGPAVLKLGRQSGETTVDLALKIPAAAAQAGVLPAAGKVKLMFGNLGDTEAAITINAKTVKIAAGVGGPTSPNGPTLELAPGKYKYALQIAGRPVRTSELTVGADDTWGLMVAPGGNAVMSLQMY
jgi:hypothetical protein